MIIGLVGEKLAGKDTAANYLVSKYNASHFRFTHILDAILEELNLPVSRKNEIDLGLNLRKVFGDHILINALEQRIKKSMSGYKVVNGIRMDEMEVVKNWGAKIIYITAPVELRFKRYNERHEKADDAEMDFEDFKKQDLSITEAAIPELGKKADFKIENVGTVEELQAKLDAIINQFKNQRF
jgi:dephospho-CoA kinase